MPRPSEKLSFAGALGDALDARLDLPDGEPLAYAIFAHCFTCSKDFIAASRIGAALAGRGIAVLRFDFTGLGDSGGDFADTNFTTNVKDVVAAANFLRGHRKAPTILVGHSFGGAVVLSAVSEIPEIKAVATIAAPAEPAHVRHLIETAVGEIEEAGEADVTIAGRVFRIRGHFLEDIAAVDLQPKVAGMRRALLVMHAPRDGTVGIENAAEIFAWARHPKSFVSLDDVDHLLTRPADSEYVGAVLTAWVGRYVGR